MDFGSLLKTAKENEQTKKEVRVYNTKFTPPKKEEKKAKSLSANIQKFLARKEAEEKTKLLEATKKRDELLALRSKDKKATRRVNVMLKRTKSANQSVIADAVDQDNTAVTLVGPSQPDEDDYGYVSQEAAAYYNKMMEKYNKIPDDPKFATSKKRASNNLSSTKDRVKAALEKEKLDALMPHKRKRKHEEVESMKQNENENEDEDVSVSPVKMKSKSVASPAMNFNDLLKLAAVKQHEPIMIEVKPKEEEGPLLTKKQKKELEKEQQRKLHKNLQQPTNNKVPSKPAQTTQTEFKIKKTLNNNIAPKLNGKISTHSQDSKLKLECVKSMTSAQKLVKPVKSNEIHSKNMLVSTENTKSNEPLRPPKLTKVTSKLTTFKAPIIKQEKEKLAQTQKSLQSKSFPPNDLKPKQFPPPDVKRKASLTKQTLVKRRIIHDEDYDSEMDDFIDDGPDEMQDYSKYIKDIFGYDKSKYRCMDDDDVDNMESSFAQQMKEDVRSTKLGIMEDLEDIKREKEEKKRKAIVMKKRKL
ncbi:hypothetical protein FQA39_LY14678 [Lamprigera yunnana]|nr:hypothetical protein FQA39_LY14678 [Lamprigera yunnana]